MSVPVKKGLSIRRADGTVIVRVGGELWTANPSEVRDLYDDNPDRVVVWFPESQFYVALLGRQVHSLFNNLVKFSFLDFSYVADGFDWF